ncbi:MAG: DUF2200 domain-containing protein [Oscillospiraceae bacterium]|jgi:hypothetical protein|nr:DUF2200 domain-containing protein [Oscillospiraceae bacterium]
MAAERIFTMPFANVYPLLVQKAARKGRTPEEVDACICWLTGYDTDTLHRMTESGADYRTLFERAPRLHPNADRITGTICGIRIEEIQDPLMQNIRRLDKLIDELAKGRPLAKILRP